MGYLNDSAYFPDITPLGHFPAQVYFSTVMPLILYWVKIAGHPRS